MQLGHCNPKCTLLVDTGAELSLVKINIINQLSSFINTDEILSFTGINTLPVKTMGSFSTEIVLPNNLKIKHKFQVMHSSFPIPTDGILGRDFLRKYRCSINYDKWLLSGFFNSDKVYIPIEDNIEGIFILPP